MWVEFCRQLGAYNLFISANTQALSLFGGTATYAAAAIGHRDYPQAEFSPSLKREPSGATFYTACAPDGH